MSQAMTQQQGVWGVCMGALCGVSAGVGVFLSLHAADSSADPVSVLVEDS